MQVKVELMINDRGKKAPNHYVITTKEGQYYQCYDDIIAFRDNEGNIVLDKYKWKVSKVASKFRNLFTGDTPRGTQSKINKGIYKLKNLNKESDGL